MCQDNKYCPCDLPPANLKEVAGIVATPMQWLEEKQKELKMIAKKKYFITFTKRDDIEEEKWRARIRFELQRKFVVSFKMCFEHADTNLHAHVILESNKYLRKSDIYRTFIGSYGFVDIKLVQKDNGLEEYISKEGEIIEKIELI